MDEEAAGPTPGNVHQRVLKLRDAALGSRKTISVESPLAHASYECAVDSLLALYGECSSETSGLSRDKYITRFLTKYEGAVKYLNKLRLTPSDFSVKAVIGRGHFGEVQVVHEKSTGDVYAMKVMKKSHILQQADAAFFLEERDIMAWTTSQWLTSLHYAFQDSSHLYLVMDFHPGGDLLSVMEKNEGGMSESDARFYLAEIAVGLDDLHQLGFVHRDIKPENVLITRSGHIKLVDFGSAARLGSEGKVLESRLPVGTPEYIAPEVLTSLDHSADYGVGCDWWSLGIIAYELVYDVTPFSGSSTSETYSNIMNYQKSLSFPEGGKEASDELRDMVCGLLTSHDTRLTFSGLRDHPFFSPTDWDSLHHSLPPYIPSVCAPDDTANFEDFETQRDCGDDHLVTPLSQQRGQRGFSGKSLPFIGFTFTRMDSLDLDLNNLSASEESLQARERRSGGRGRGGGGGGGEEDVSGLKRELDSALKELKKLKERKWSLERECVIYQSQLEDFHRKLEIEKVERRLSDSQALQLLEEVRVQGKIAQQLREGEAESTCEDLKVVIEQLEQERGVASKRARRLQDELQKVQQERDGALKKVSEYKSKLAEVKQSGRKDISALQVKLAKVTKDSVAKVTEMQNRLTEAHSRVSESSKRLQEAESEKRKLEFGLQQAQSSGSAAVSSTSETARAAMAKRLEEAENARTKAGEQVEDLKHQLEFKAQENSSLQTQCTQLSQQVKELEDQWQSANSRQEQLEAVGWDLKTRLEQMSREKEKAVAVGKQAERSMKDLEKIVSELQSEKDRLEDELKSQRSTTSISGDREGHVGDKREELQTHQVAEREKEVKSLQDKLEAATKEVRQLKESLRSVQVQLSETSNLYIAQGDKLREVRRSRLQLDQENTTLKTSLSRSKSEVRLWTKKFEDMGREMDSLNDLKKTVSELQKEIETLINRNKAAKREVEVSRAQRGEAVAARAEADTALRNSKKEIEAQELSVALLENKLSSMEEELTEARGWAEEERGREKDCREGRDHLQADLKSTEKILEDAYAELEKEKAQRATLEQRLAGTLSSLEKTAAAHGEEQRRLADQLATQKRLASKYSDRVSELERESRLRGLELKEAMKELETEKSLASKLYDDLHSLGREHGKLKAAHFKMLEESHETASKLSEEAVAREKALEQQRAAEETCLIQETKLQSTIAQQSKLIDFLRKPTPPSRGVRFKFKLSRKSRDPAKELADWNKIKGLAAKQDGSSRSSSLPRIPSSTPTLLSARSRLSAPTVSSTAPPQLSTPPPPVSKNVVHLPPTHDDTQTPSVMVSEFPSSASDDVMRTTPTSVGSSREISPTTHLQGPVLKRVSVDIHKQTTITETSQDVQQPLDQTPQRKGGKKRGLEASSSSSSRLAMEHNIPHRFVSKSAPLHKSYVCSFCKNSIKPMQKFVKCSHCGQTCHPKCSGQLPNNCGLPAELVDFALPSSAKKSRQEEEEEEKVEEGAAEKPGSSRVTRRRDETTKIGKVFVPKGEVKAECWLVLTESSLNCHDRHPAGITRKPLSSFCWTDPQNLVVVLSRVDSRPSPYMSPSRNQYLFAVEQHSAAVGTKRAVFVTETMKEKQEWVQAVEAAISRNSGVLGGSSEQPTGSAPSTRSSVTAVTATMTRSRRAAAAVANRPRPASTTPCTYSSPDSSVV